jgi:hypothetical protein
MDSKGNSIDRFSIEADSGDPKYAEWSSNTLSYSGSNRYTINLKHILAQKLVSHTNRYTTNCYQTLRRFCI